jgi:predicted ATPase
MPRGMGQPMPGEMPGPPTPSDLAPGGLIGRAAEAAAIRHTLDGARLVTVTGPPGVGKTAVSLVAAGAAAGSFANGSLLLRLDTLRDEALLTHTIAAALRLPDQFTRSRLEMLVDQLRDRQLLLILDTCEHLLGACAALVEALLPPCPTVQVLATSREPLRVPGEATVAVRPLRLANAVKLFGQRAAQAGVWIAPQHRAAVASICVQLDKLPLAIELAASELGRLGQGQPPAAALAELLTRLEAGHDLPSGLGQPEQHQPEQHQPERHQPERHQPERHRTLRAAIGWSHVLCTPSERLLWARLSAFTGPFGSRDAQDVCASSELPDGAVAACLSLLAERSVLLTGQQDGGDARFLLPITLRAYGRGMLRRLGQDDEFAARYRRWQDGRRPHHDAAAEK